MISILLIHSPDTAPLSTVTARSPWSRDDCQYDVTDLNAPEMMWHWQGTSIRKEGGCRGGDDEGATSSSCPKRRAVIRHVTALGHVTE
eukprot:3525093-Rhodomonas_salina.2